MLSASAIQVVVYFHCYNGEVDQYFSINSDCVLNWVLFSFADLYTLTDKLIS